MAQVATQTYEFAIINAFTRSPFGGNPALVVFLDAPLQDESAYLKITENFNQPIACFVFPSDESSPLEATTATFRVRWFAPKVEAPFCGHGTLATTHAILSRPGLVSPHVRELRLAAMHGCVSSRRVTAPVPASGTGDGSAGERIEIELPAFDAVPVDDAEFARIKKAVAKALRKEDVQVNYIGVSGSGEAGSDFYLLIELDEKEGLADADIDTDGLVGTAPYYINVMTNASSKPGVTYETRMFAPRGGLPEDHVCGSANCLMAPYWANKLGVASNEVMFAKQVSKRGGDLWKTTPDSARAILNAQPAIGYALVPLMVRMGIVNLEVLQKTLSSYSASQMQVQAQAAPAVPPHVAQAQQYQQHPTPPPASQTPNPMYPPGTTSYAAYPPPSQNGAQQHPAYANQFAQPQPYAGHVPSQYAAQQQQRPVSAAPPAPAPAPGTSMLLGNIPDDQRVRDKLPSYKVVALRKN
ncbi:hypothetical protein EW145_g896 [Phellinidium pouzarii]|uniref:Phenazine biosynthesis protein n=1 Tax=Phellinidium pouzarii TaxID=167371 RepID=A0A4S4LGQ6_9AGAM|nr:hypothetical protein EW145_g896 [Phellinidium pouzarii]